MANPATARQGSASQKTSVAEKPISIAARSAMQETVVAVRPATAPRWASQSPPSMAPSPTAEVSQASPLGAAPEHRVGEAGSSSMKGRAQIATTVRTTSIGPIPLWRAA